MDGQLSIFDVHDGKLRPCDYKFKRYIGQKVRFNCSCGDGGEHVITGIEEYYTILDDGRWVGTPTTIHSAEEG